MARHAKRRKTAGRSSEQLRFSALTAFADRIRDAAGERGITPQAWMLWACEQGLEVQARERSGLLPAAHPGQAAGQDAA